MESLEKRIAAIEEHLGLTKKEEKEKKVRLKVLNSRAGVDLVIKNGETYFKLTGDDDDHIFAGLDGCRDKSVTENSLKWVLWEYVDKLLHKGVI